MTNSAPVFTAGGGSDDAFTRVSTSATGAQADGASVQAAFSPDGTKVAFASYADNLVPGDTNGAPDVFVKDLSTGAITLVSTDASGVQLGGYQPIFSPDGTKLAFATGADIFVKDLATGALTRVSTSASGEQADGLSTTNPIFSPDGTKVAFYSDADNLVPDDTDHVRDIFVKDLTTGAITLIAPSPYNGGPGGGGLENGFTFPPRSRPMAPKSCSGRPQCAATPEIYIKDLSTGATTLVSESASGARGDRGSFDPVFSPDGTKVAFYTFADNLVPGSSNNLIGNIVIKDLTTGAVTLVSTDADGVPQNNGEAQKPVFSPDGTKIAFYSSATNLVPGVNADQVVYVKDLATGAITAVSTNGGRPWEFGGGSRLPVFSPDGTKVAFESLSSILVPGDTNHTYDIFVRDLTTPSFTAAKLTDNGAAHVSTSQAGFFAGAHTVAVAPQDGNLGTLTATIDVADGKVTWSYDVSHANIAPLAAGQTHTDIFILVLDGFYGTQGITVTLTGIDDAPVISSGTTASFAENGSGVAYHVAATDVDSPALTYSLSGTDAALFDVSATGDVTFKSAPDFEAPKDANHDNVYDVTVAVSDGTEIATKNVAITVTDVNDTSGGGGVLTVTGSTGFTSIDRATINISVTGNLHETGSAGVISNSTINNLGSLSEAQAMLAFVNDTIAGGSLGAIVANGGTITFDNVHLDGTSLDAISGGLIESVAGSANSFNNVTLKAGAVFDDSAASALNVSGTLNNGGKIEFFNFAKAILTGDTTVIGNGEIKLDPGSSILNSGGHHTLDLEGGTIDGAGTIGNGDHSLTLDIGFSGTLEANGSQPLAVNTGNSVTSSGLIEAVHGSLDFDDAVFNTVGTITADQAGTIAFKNGLTNGGIVNVHTGSEVDVSGNLVNNGTVLDSGMLKVDNLSGTGAVNVNNGTLVVTGNLSSNVVLTGADSFVFGPDAKQTSGVISNYTPGTTLVLDGFDTKVNAAFDAQTGILTLTDADHHAMTLHLAPGSLIPQAHGAAPDFLV
ncbi:VCBS repeat-containing protein [Bradyrhizobium japonicum]|uniref:DPP IV N-terminal domain-containing protein n=1 Tax=Bradyrhizobium TaxID=374 RepID=UPI0004102FE3|nr:MULTISPECIES: DPP IV N-terminal domain-containing protein [Bradyrhizobium]MCP1746181.1 VCBS repeat-containing protein [Bradyrhizobium japonicum]MCP1773856.1 VCBS repeat-containing protein [Bradyrhizobium japonicum]MCP1864081.1 VCBS repeat-containing protein [Bradyrhizobium japonicum]MCP1894668.1 VCBS repeat-containing protein [Bradyrhizobium japonicum]MCP1963144.1 VCBS repeat-containing protein [Bradyrhizobium japonicum]